MKSFVSSPAPLVLIFTKIIQQLTTLHRKHGMVREMACGWHLVLFQHHTSTFTVGT